MKKLNYYLMIAMAAIIGFTTSCKEEEPEELLAPAAPTIEVTVDTSGTEFMPGTELNFTIVATPTEGVLGILTVTPSIESGTGSALDSYVYNTTEEVNYSYTVPFDAGATININFEVTAKNADDLSLESSAEYDYTFSVTNAFTESTVQKAFSFE